MSGSFPLYAVLAFTLMGWLLGFLFGYGSGLHARRRPRVRLREEEIPY